MHWYSFSRSRHCARGRGRAASGRRRGMRAPGWRCDGGTPAQRTAAREARARAGRRVGGGVVVVVACVCACVCAWGWPATTTAHLPMLAARSMSDGAGVAARLRRVSRSLEPGRGALVAIEHVLDEPPLALHHRQRAVEVLDARREDEQSARRRLDGDAGVRGRAVLGRGPVVRDARLGPHRLVAEVEQRGEDVQLPCSRARAREAFGACRVGAWERQRGGGGRPGPAPRSGGVGRARAGRTQRGPARLLR